MRIIITILLWMVSWAAQARKVTATVSGGNISVATNAQSVYSLVDGDTLEIPATATGYVGIGNIQASGGQLIYIVVASRVTIDQLEFRDLTNVRVILRDPTYGWGVWLTNASGRALLLNGVIHNVRIQGVRIYNPADYGIYATHTRTHDNTYANKNTNLFLDSILIMKAGNTPNAANAVSIGGGTNSGGVLTGVWDTLTITHLRIDSGYGAQGVELYSCFRIRLKNDSITHSGGISDTNHLGMFYIRGQLDTAENVYINDCWGNGFRLNSMALVASKAAPKGEVYIFNSVITNSRKYPGIEVNNDNGQYDSSSTYLRPSNVHVLYSTLGAFRSHNVAGQGSCISAYTHGGGTISVIGCILFKSYLDHPTQTDYSHTFYNGDGSGAVNDSTGTVYDSDGTTYLSDTAHGVSRVDMPGTVTAPYQSFILSSFNGNTRPTRGYWRPGAYSFDGVDSGGSPVIKRKNRLLINK